jgi:hypothetical protein
MLESVHTELANVPVAKRPNFDIDFSPIDAGGIAPKKALTATTSFPGLYLIALLFAFSVD